MKSIILVRPLLAAVVGAVLLVPNIVAGDINGRIPISPNNGPVPIVVWVQGVKNFSIPKSRPTVTQHRGEFNPPLLVIVAGQTVEMPNQDEVAHNVYSTSKVKPFNLGYYATGDHKNVTFDQPGVVDLACSIHKFMQGRILVVPNPYFAQVKADGSFRIQQVPAGSYVLKFWSNDGRELSRQVTVPATGAVVAKLELTTNEKVGTK